MHRATKLSSYRRPCHPWRAPLPKFYAYSRVARSFSYIDLRGQQWQRMCEENLMNLLAGMPSMHLTPHSARLVPPAFYGGARRRQLELGMPPHAGQ